MTRSKSIAVGVAVLTTVVAATTALAMNTLFVVQSGASAATADAPVTTTTTYEQYLEEWYAANPTSTEAPAASDTVEPVVVYEIVDVPVSVPPPEVIYVPVPADAGSAAAGPADDAAARSAAPPSSAPPSTTAPTTTAPPMDLLTFAFYDIAEITVASHGGGSLQLWQVDARAPWVWEVEKDNGHEVELEFYNPSNDKEAEFEMEIDGAGFELKTEGDGYGKREEHL